MQEQCWAESPYMMASSQQMTSQKDYVIQNALTYTTTSK